MLVTEAVAIRTQGILCEVLFPEAQGQEMDVEGGMGIEALEHIDELDGRIHAL
jgi:hypothetical protein